MEEKVLIIKICKERGCFGSIQDYCLNHSNGRTKQLDELSPSEISNLLKTLQYFNDENMLNGIYTISKTLKIIKEHSKEKDGLIIEYLKSKCFIERTTNVIKVPGHEPENIIISNPLKNISYTGKLMVANILGNIYIEKLTREN